MSVWDSSYRRDPLETVIHLREVMDGHDSGRAFLGSLRGRVRVIPLDEDSPEGEMARRVHSVTSRLLEGARNNP